MICILGCFKWKIFKKIVPRAKKKKWSHIETHLDLETKLQTLMWQANGKIWKASTFSTGQQRLKSFKVIWRKLHVDKGWIEGVGSFMTADWSKAESVSLTSLQTCLCGKYIFTDKLQCAISIGHFHMISAEGGGGTTNQLLWCN